MNKTFRNFLVVLFGLLLFSNCAKKGAPSGGPRDSIPPLIIKSNPENFTTNFSGDEIRIYFDEYIKLKDLQQNLIISPPLDYQPIITPLGTSKVLKIKILDTLKENTTYSINFGKSIVDNNEENEFEYFKYIFSTGAYIDSLTVSGRIEDALLLKPTAPTTVMLYEITEEFTDSIIYSEKPTYITITKDSTQTFELSNLKEGKYLLLALQEKINNYIFEPKKDKIGFVNEVVSTPNDSTYRIAIFSELIDYAIARPSQVSKHEILFGYEGQVDTLDVIPISNVPAEFEYRSFFGARKDTLHFFFKPAIDIEQTDTLEFLTRNRSQLDTVIVRMRDLFADSLRITRLGRTTVIPRDTLKLQLNLPLEQLNEEHIKVMNKDSMPVSFQTAIDRRYNIASIIFDKTDEQQYSVAIFPNAFVDYFENTNDTLSYGIRTTELSDYGELGMRLENISNFPVLVELVNSKYKVVASEYLNSNEELYFDYLSPDQYYFRIIFDTNQNGRWDTGSFLQKRQPEKVIYFPKPIDIRTNVYINEIFTLD